MSHYIFVPQATTLMTVLVKKYINGSLCFHFRLSLCATIENDHILCLWANWTAWMVYLTLVEISLKQLETLHGKKNYYIECINIVHKSNKLYLAIQQQIERIWIPYIRQHSANINSIMIKPIFLLNQWYFLCLLMHLRCSWSSTHISSL